MDGHYLPPIGYPHPPSSDSEVDVKCSKHVAYKEYFLTSILSPSRAPDHSIQLKKEVNGNDALARPTMIDKIASKSLDRIEKETHHSPITFATVHRGERGRAAQSQEDGTSSVVVRHRRL
jgi:hypothetical protein